MITRWNTWFEAALYHAEHLDVYVIFVDAETEHGSTQQLHKLSTLLHNEQQLNELRAELEFLAVHCQRLITVLKSLEERQFKAVDIYNCMADLLSWLRNPGFPYATPGCEDAMTNAAEKLSEYLEGTKQPAIQLCTCIRPKAAAIAVTYLHRVRECHRISVMCCRRVAGIHRYCSTGVTT